MKLVEGFLLLTLLGLSRARPGLSPPESEVPDLIPLTQELGLRLFPFPHLARVRSGPRVSLTQDTAASQTDARLGFFSDNPLISVKRSFQDIQTNVERSMQSLMAAGSAIGHRMLDMITRSPRLLLPASDTAHSHHSAHAHAHPGPAHSGENFPDFKNCDCHFGSDSVSPTQFRPYHEAPDLAPALTGPVTNDLESYGAPAAEVITYPGGESYGAPAAPALDNYSGPQAPVAPALAPATPAPPPPPAPSHSATHSEAAHEAGPIIDLTNEVYIDGVATIDGEPVLSHEPVIHPGGSQGVDYNKVSHVGVHTVVQASSAQVPDQSHPEKYLNHNHDHLIDVVEHNLWYKQTKQFKHHHHGEKLRVIPHIAPPAPGGPAQ